MKLEDLEPGPELDALVAEKVMGWEKATSFQTGEWRYWIDSSTEDIVHTIFSDPIRPIPGDFRPSTRIADAWEVVEKLKRGCCIESCSLDNKRFDVAFWKCACSLCASCATDCSRGENDALIWVHAEANTAPLAICLAALKAVGYETPQ